ncbi:hypothetical protein RND71_034200 [Anisodus tanguticus]|uniref:Autophagy-related protein 101 n=1 Tax=Anisodus tanguticus TaxID=243964 RepID=A0AAE1V2B3_9SOLA|nr:hypothetical protein RND71_034200 [Anisodus tanguticus]
MQICLSFCEVKNKQTSWFASKVERFYWEYWYINLNVAHHPKGHSGKSHLSKVVDPGESACEETSAQRTVLESSLRGCYRLDIQPCSADLKFPDGGESSLYLLYLLQWLIIPRLAVNISG